MDLSRRDVVIGAVPRDYGKPQPAVVVQSDFFNETHVSIEAPLFLMAVEPGGGTGLKKASQVMVDKVMSVPRERIAKKTRRHPVGVLHLAGEALWLWL